MNFIDLFPRSESLPRPHEVLWAYALTGVRFAAYGEGIMQNPANTPDDFSSLQCSPKDLERRGWGMANRIGTTLSTNPDHAEQTFKECCKFIANSHEAVDGFRGWAEGFCIELIANSADFRAKLCSGSQRDTQPFASLLGRLQGHAFEENFLAKLQGNPTTTDELRSHFTSNPKNYLKLASLAILSTQPEYAKNIGCYLQGEYVQRWINLTRGVLESGMKSIYELLDKAKDNCNTCD